MAKKKQSFKSKAINAVLSAIIRTLLGWAEEWGNDAFFFIVIGDKTCTDVAWHNTEMLSLDGALAVAYDAEAAGALQDLSGSVDILLEEQLKDDDFREKFQLTCPDKNSMGWHSYENICGGKAFTDEQNKKGGAK